MCSTLRRAEGLAGRSIGENVSRASKPLAGWDAVGAGNDGPRDRPTVECWNLEPRLVGRSSAGADARARSRQRAIC